MDTSVNGPAGDALCWDAIDWRSHEDNVRRLRQRIFTAARDGNLGTLRNLQKLMLRSWSNTLLSVRRGDAAQCWAEDGRDRRGDRAELPDQGGAGGAGAP